MNTLIPPETHLHHRQRKYWPDRKFTMSPDRAALEIVIVDDIAQIWIDRPPVNALNWDLKRELTDTLHRIADDPTIRALVFTSRSERIFCAGSDLSELIADHDVPGSAWERTSYEYELWESLGRLTVPSIAAIEGYALGSGTELAIACDFRVAGDNAHFGLPEIRIGGAPGIQSITRLVSMVGLSAARRMLLLGEPVTAQVAAELGLADYLAAPGGALDRAMELARQLANQPRSSIGFLKAALASTLRPGLEQVFALQERDVETLFTSPEMDEGISAFLEKREADFRQLDRSVKA